MLLLHQWWKWIVDTFSIDFRTSYKETNCSYEIFIRLDFINSIFILFNISALSFHRARKKFLIFFLNIHWKEALGVKRYPIKLKIRGKRAMKYRVLQSSQEYKFASRLLTDLFETICVWPPMHVCMCASVLSVKCTQNSSAIHVRN